MSCDLTEKISQLIDGELSEVEAREVQRHLTQCVPCQEARADFLSFRSEISNYNPSLHPVAQADALKRILGRPVEQPRITPARPKLGWRGSFAPRAVAFASLILIAALVGFIVYRATQNKHVEPPLITEKKPLPVFAPTPQVTPSSSHDPVHVDPPKSDSGPAKSKQIRRIAPLVKDGSNIAQVQPDADTTQPSNTEKAGDIHALTAMHLQTSELLLRAFRNVRAAKTGRPVDVAYEQKLAQQTHRAKHDVEA